MKRGTPDHWKMDELARALKIPVRYGRTWANGCLERLWHYTARQYPRGDIGSAPDWAIADACGWPKQDADKLIAALLQAKWIDSHPKFRLIVHDWAEHCDDAVKKTLKNRGLSFCFPENSSLPLPLPLPLPRPEPVPTVANAATAPARTVTPIRPAPQDAEQRVRVLAEHQPDQQDFEIGINRAVQELADSANPETTLRTLEENLPLWWEAMRDGRAKPKKLRYVIADGDYLRRPREPSIPKARKSAFDEPYREATT